MSEADPLPEDYTALRARARRRKRGGGGGGFKNIVVRALIALFVLVVVLPTAWVLLYRVVEAPGTILMAQRAGQGAEVRRNVVPIERISPHLVRAVIAAEDSRFCVHNGFDWEAIEAATEYNRKQQAKGSDRRRGASTISQQTAKNLFLWPQRSWLRKGLEVYFTGLTEFFWPKRRVMEAYLNAAEWGDGLFGAEAAAQARFGKAAKDLTPREAARLAAVLPSPNKWSADRPGPYVRRRAAAIEQRMRVVRTDGLAACVLGEAEPKPATPKPAKRAPAKSDAPPVEPPAATPLPDLPEPPPELAPLEDGAPATEAGSSPELDAPQPEVPDTPPPEEGQPPATLDDAPIY